MKIKKTILVAGITTIFFTNTLNASEAEKLFDNKCAMCHIKTIPTDRTNMVAPALMGVMRHVKMAYPDKKNAIKFMVDYVLNPTKEKAICMPQKIAHFGLMPSQKGNVTVEELEKITSWMYDNFPPANFQGRGMGRGSRGW